MRMRKIEVNEGGLSVLFTVSEEGIVELARFAPDGLHAEEKSAADPSVSGAASAQPSVSEPDAAQPSDADPSVSEPDAAQPSADGQPEDPVPVIELQITGRSTRGLHGYRHNSSSASLDLKYVRHEIRRGDSGLELVIFLESDYGLKAAYHMVFFRGVQAVRVFSELKNDGDGPLPVEYISSFVFQNLCGNGRLPYYEKTDVYVPRSSWYCEARWQKEDIEFLNLSRMVADGFNSAGFGANRFTYSGISS